MYIFFKRSGLMSTVAPFVDKDLLRVKRTPEFKHVSCQPETAVQKHPLQLSDFMKQPHRLLTKFKLQFL